MTQTVFHRIETKYVLSREQMSELLEIIEPNLKHDKYFKETNLSIYFDTDEKWLGIHSLEKPLYKEKIRVRSYGVPKTLDETVFVEIKKKFDGMGYKRRIEMKLADFYEFLRNPKTEKFYSNNRQIEKEVKYCFEFYKLKPALLLAYDRTSFVGRKEPAFRLTFDRNIRSREDNLKLEKGDRGKLYFNEGEIVMEAKTALGYPKWFVDAISKLKIYPASFSKYGRVLQKIYN